MSGIGAAVSVGGNLLSGLFGKSSAKKAAKAQQAALEQAKAQAIQTQQQVQGLYQPYVNTGNQTRQMQLQGIMPKYTPEQLAQEQEKYRLAQADWQNTLIEIKKGEDWWATTHPEVKKLWGSLENAWQKTNPTVWKKIQAGEPVAPTNDGRGQFNQSAIIREGLSNIEMPDLTPEEWVAQENAAGRTITPEQANWNKNFSVEEYLKSQGKAANALNQNFEDTDFQLDPSFNFRKQQGLKGIESSAAAKGMQLSGATLKALNTYNSDLASQEYGAASNRFNVNRSNLVQNTAQAGTRFDADRNALYGKFVDAYGREVDQYGRELGQLNAISGAAQKDYENLGGFSTQGFQSTGVIADSYNALGDTLTKAAVGSGNIKATNAVTQGQLNSGMMSAIGSGINTLLGSTSSIKPSTGVGSTIGNQNLFAGTGSNSLLGKW